MKYMKLGTRPDTFYTEAATRTVLSDVPTDLIIQINNTRYLLHKFPLLLKCGLLQRFCSNSSTSSSSSTISTATSPILIPDFPGGEAAFELCAKFCYNISITLSAHNFIPAFSAATNLLMTKSVSQPNLLPKLQTFFLSFILPNWKDSVLTIASASHSSPPFSDPTIISPLIDSIISKILVPPSQVTWSFTYSRELQSTPKDWWTEDIAEFDLNHFRSIISSIRSNKMFPPPLIGEALHVYTVKNLPDPNQTVTDWNNSGKYRRVLEAIASMLPVEVGAVSGGFLMRLLKIAILVEASTSVKAELVRRAGRQLDEASIRDLMVSCRSRDEEIAVVEAVVNCFLEGFRRRRRREGREERERMRRVAKVFDEYLSIVARDDELEVDKFVELVGLVPLVEREVHDGLYRAIDNFLEEHTNLSKAERKRLCQLIDCKKLSSEARSEAIANNRLPLRILVQLLYVEQERAGRISGSHGTPPIAPQTSEQAQVSRKGGGEEEEEHRHQQREETVEDGWDEVLRLGKKGEGSGSSNTLHKVRGEAQVQKKKMDRRGG